MIGRHSFIIWLALLLIGSSPLFAGSIGKEEQEQIKRRAAELAPSLSESPVSLVPPITDRQAWTAFSKLPGNQGYVANAEKLLAQPIPQTPEELYKEFYKNGNRSHYQNVNSARIGRLGQLAMAELIEGKGRFLPALEESIRDLCAFPSWVLPAHDTNGEIYDGKRVSADLVATYIGGNLAMLRLAMKDVLSPEVSDLIAENVRHRILTPYIESVQGENLLTGMWWIVKTNNWNAVCHCGTVAAALALCESSEERAWFLAAAEQFTAQYFFTGFTPDGYCSEGISYWNYGFGNFAQLAEIMLVATNGKVNLFTLPKAAAVSWFGPRMEIAPNCYAAFADCPLSSKPNRQLLALLSKRIGMGLTAIEKSDGYPNRGANDLITAATFAFPHPQFPATMVTETIPAPLDQPRTDFPDAGVLICRAKAEDLSSLSAVFKGGNNDELHNHNDLGSYGILFDRQWALLDPGGETYTARTFSSRRYEGELLNSFGHPVPRINGHLQTTGEKAKAIVLEKSFSDEKDVFALDLTSAYDYPEIQRVTRRFEFERNPAGKANQVVVTDRIDFQPGQTGTVETALVTFNDWVPVAKKVDDGQFVEAVLFIPLKATENSKESVATEGKGIRVTMSAVDGDGKCLGSALRVGLIGQNDDQVPKKPTRIAFVPNGEMSSVIITTVIVPVM